jgi:hypothetical protein
MITLQRNAPEREASTIIATANHTSGVYAMLFAVLHNAIPHAYGVFPLTQHESRKHDREYPMTASNNASAPLVTKASVGKITALSSL